MHVLTNVAILKEELLTQAHDVVHHDHMGQAQLREVAETLGVHIKRLVDASFGRPASKPVKNGEEEGEAEGGDAIPSTSRDNCCTDTTFSETGKEAASPAMLSKLFDLLKELNSSLEFEKEAAKDREKRLMIQIKKLSPQVTELSAALETAKAEQEASERRITKILQDTKSRITTNTANYYYYYYYYYLEDSPTG